MSDSEIDAKLKFFFHFPWHSSGLNTQSIFSSFLIRTFSFLTASVAKLQGCPLYLFTLHYIYLIKDDNVFTTLSASLPYHILDVFASKVRLATSILGFNVNFAYDSSHNSLQLLFYDAIASDLYLCRWIGVDMCYRVRRTYLCVLKCLWHTQSATIATPEKFRFYVERKKH